MATTEQPPRFLTQEEAEHQTQLLTFLSFSNKTHQSLIHKRIPGSEVNIKTSEAEVEYKDFVGRLVRDGTKTPTLKTKLAAEQANKLYIKVLSQVDKEGKASSAVFNDLQHRYDKEMAFKGANDMMIRQQQGALVQEMDWSEIMSSIRSGDIETAKALTLPLLKNRFQLNSNAARAETLAITTQQAVLGKEGYAQYAQANKASAALNNVGEAAVQQVEANQEVIDAIAKTIIASGDS